VPEPKIEESVMIVPGTDGQKMSKSYNNFINIFLPEQELHKVIRGIKTDSKGVEEPKDPDTCNVFNLLKLVDTPERTLTLRRMYVKGGVGYGAFKNDLFAAIMNKFATARQTYNHLMANTQELDAILKKGAAKAATIANPVLARVRHKLGYL
jgi:tryptophanyl-tRNA synthetase